MTVFQSILLGIIQGMTEFLPVSSSGHLVIVPFLLGWKLPETQAFIFNVLVQVATLLAVFAYFYRDLQAILLAVLDGLKSGRPFANPMARLGWLIVLATIPAGLIGLLVKDMVEQAFATPLVVGISLLITAGLLVFAERIGKNCQQPLECLSWSNALWIGLFQALAIFPGVSRSGSTIVGGMTAHLERPAAARFSFLMSIPIMLAAGMLAIKDLVSMPELSGSLAIFIPGFIAAALVGYISIRWLIGYLTRHPLHIFSIYCTLMGLLVIGVSLFAR